MSSTTIRSISLEPKALFSFALSTCPFPFSPIIHRTPSAPNNYPYIWHSSNFSSFPSKHCLAYIINWSTLKASFLATDGFLMPQAPGLNLHYITLNMGLQKHHKTPYSTALPFLCLFFLDFPAHPPFNSLFSC